MLLLAGIIALIIFAAFSLVLSQLLTLYDQTGINAVSAQLLSLAVNVLGLLGVVSILTHYWLSKHKKANRQTLRLCYLL